MKKLLVLLCILFAVCSALFSATYAEGKTLDVYPDTMLSGKKFAIQFNPKERAVTLTNYGSAKTLMVKGNKTGTSEVKIESNGSLDYDSMVNLIESNTVLNLILAADNGIVAKAIISNIDSKDFNARLNKVGSAEYVVGDTGPAGGIIFYDKGDSSDGWRYLEAAPADLRVIDGVPSVDKSDPWYDFGDETVVFGYYRNGANGNNLYVNGTTSYNRNDCTDTALGTGRKNTELLVKAMGNSAYTDASGSDTAEDYAARLCWDLEFNGFDDWFLPSKGELNLMYENRSVIGGFASNVNYWSSSETNGIADYAWFAWLQYFYDGYQDFYSRFYNFRVRPVRAFISADDVPEHKHTYSSAWTSDDTYHWHTATCEHSEEVSGIIEHVFTEWTVIQEPTCSQTGIRTRTCSVCGYEESVAFQYSVGDIRPAGSYVFYDCDADNDSGNADGLISSEVGWRYLEAAPDDIKQGSEIHFMWGDDVELDTRYGIGTGMTNTAIIVSKASKSRNPNAATLCNDFTYGGYDDWFLPSKDELNMMYENLKENGLGGFADWYWSSSGSYIYYFGDLLQKSYNSYTTAWRQNFSSGSQYDGNRYGTNRVRPVRAFDEHTYSSEWTSDSTYHWHTATCEHTEFVSGKIKHTFSEWTVIKEATPLQAGIRTRTCSVCGYEESEDFYPVGSLGPAGGYIFYDCDADNDSGNADGLISSEVGWRYLEAAPADIEQGSAVEFMWGDNGEFSTQPGIGTGKTNTAIIVTKASNSINSNAATLCNDFTYGGYDDWFLPSKDELNKMYLNLQEKGLGGFANYYWSSSENYKYTNYAWFQFFSSGSKYDDNRDSYNRVRPVRAF